MKCANCSCNEFYIMQDLETSNGERVKINGCAIKAYLCKKCGKIEFYSPLALKKFKDYEEKKKQEEAAEKARKEKIDSLNKEIEELKAIIGDDNQTVKAVREASSKLEEKEKELEEAKRQ